MNKKFEKFIFQDVFEFERGKRLIEAEHIQGDIAYISSKKQNNGIYSFVTPPEFMKIYKNKMTLTNSGSVGYLFYHDYEFIASDHVTVIWIKDKSINLNKNISLYLKPIIEKIRYKYNFGREISNKRLAKEIIMLPVNKHNKIDWLYMDQYISESLSKIQFNNLIPRVIRENIALDIDKWGRFRLIDIWEEQEDIKITNDMSCKKVKRGERLKSEDRLAGDIPYYSASEYNNGRTDSISNPIYTVRDALIYTTFGDCFYVEGEFTASDEISIFRHSKLNKYNGLFISTVINQSKYKYKFGRKAFFNKFKNEYIKLPIDDNDNIDWEYMEKYIKLLPFADRL